MSTHGHGGAAAPLPKLALVAPAYHERDNLRPLFERVREMFAGGPTWELVLVDDGSRDDTADVIRALGDFDAVVGYCEKRRDTWVRRISSRIANSPRYSLTGDTIRDTGCALKLSRREAILSIPLFEGMHRCLLRYHGHRVAEHPVSHKPRVAGVSKHELRNHAWRATKDLFAVRWMRQRVIRYELVEESRSAAPPAERGT